MNKGFQRGLFLFGLISIFFVDVVFASGGGGATSLGDVAQNVTATFDNLGKMITAISYIAGLGFAIGAVLKFKAHKDNPTQIPIGTPIALFFVAVALLFLPTALKVASGTLFGQGATTASPKGIEITN